MAVNLNDRDFIAIGDTRTGKTSWNKSALEFCEPFHGALSIGQTADPYGRVQSGEVVGRDTNGMIHPIGYAVFTTEPASGNVVRVGTAKVHRFRVGDLVRLYDLSTDTDLASTDRTITAIDTSTGDITFDGVAINPDIGDVIKRVDGSAVPVGIAWRDWNTWSGQSDVDGNPIHQDGRPIEVLRRGTIDESELPLTLEDDIQTALETLGFRFE